MILNIIGIVLGVTAIGLIFWFRKEYKESIQFLEGEAEASEHGYRALMEDFTNYQVETDEMSAKDKVKDLDLMIEAFVEEERYEDCAFLVKIKKQVKKYHIKQKIKKL